ncbi:MAG: tetratricopeptide repeat protein [Rhodospirillales bacterium]|jgi:HemY protein|nr:tetratricopeptide repeat protein [Rhodospirillales bacterium]
MLRTLGFVIVLAVLAFGAVWFADSPGEVSLEWRGWRVDTSFAILFAVIAVFAVVVALVYRLWLFVRNAPGRVSGARRESRRRRGYLALTRGMVAVAAGDAGEANKQVRRADGLLSDPPITMLLSAQASQLSGDEAAAEKFFSAMLTRPETEFLGIRGLLTQALKGNRHKKARELAERASRLQPKSDWVASNLLDLQVRGSAWSEARATLDRSVRNKLVSADDANHRLAVLDYLLGLEALERGEAADALKVLKKSCDREPGFVPAAVRLAGLMVDRGRAARAVTLLERTWAHNPHPDVAAAYRTARGVDDPLELVKTAERLAKSNADHRESHLTVARAALEASLWGEARRHLENASGQDPSARVCRLMAELEESEHANAQAAREWLVRASKADPDPAWVCADCGNAVDVWTALCANCDGFARFSWQTPPHVVRLIEGDQAAAQATAQALSAPDAPSDTEVTAAPASGR